MMRFFQYHLSVLQSESPEQHLRRKEQSNFNLVHKLLKKKHEKIKEIERFFYSTHTVVVRSFNE